jgi:hypothetical protein
VGVSRTGWIRMAVATGCMYLVGFAGGTATAAGTCLNEALRTGRSASLPDCRAYELVTPPELGRTADITFNKTKATALASNDGNHLALAAAGAYLEPGVSVNGTYAVFSRTAAGWVMQPLPSLGTAGDHIKPELFSPDLSQFALASENALTHANSTLAAGPVGGPYSTLTTVPPEDSLQTEFAGANPGTASVPALSDVVLQSPDHAVLPPGPEREVAEQTEPEFIDLYQWTATVRRLQLVNVDNDGKLLNLCGAYLGRDTIAGNDLGAVSADGSKVFFTSPGEERTGCPPPALYMRVDGRETVEVSEPQGVSSERLRVIYDGASVDGSKVFFTTAMDLTRSAVESGGFKLYEYDTEAPAGSRLTLIATEVTGSEQYVNPFVVVAEDGSVVYYRGQYKGVHGVVRYETATRKNSLAAVTRETEEAAATSYATPNGDFFLFASGTEFEPGPEFVGPHGLEEESRGAHHEELYRYDAADGSVVCVSCGEGMPPTKGALPPGFVAYLGLPDAQPMALSISEDGRRVFFQTSAQLVPQDSNESTTEHEEQGEETYEWEAIGTEEEPGVFCGVANGCTHLISAGEAVGPEHFLGASASGRDVFFSSAAQLVPQATPEFTNIYDARIGGGFPPSAPSVECTSCQGVGSPPPLFSVPAGVSFEGAGNPLGSSVKTTTANCPKGKKLSHGRCIRAKSRRRKAKAKKAGENRRGK